MEKMLATMKKNETIAYNIKEGGIMKLYGIH